MKSSGVTNNMNSCVPFLNCACVHSTRTPRPKQLNWFQPSLFYLHLCERPGRDDMSLDAWLVFLNPQVTVPCHHLAATTTHHLAHPVTLRSGALGDPTVGHLGTERLRLLLQDPQQPQSLQLTLATAGTHGVPKDETGVRGYHVGKTMDLPVSPSPLF